MSSTSWCQQVYALTGGIGSGKSTVCGIFQGLGAYIINADELARKAVEPGSPGLRKIVATFGKGVLDWKGSLNRKALADIVFENPEDRLRLEEITHPIIHQLAEERYSSTKAALIIYDLPLLFETGLDSKGFKGIIVVYAPESLMIDRMVSYRGFPREEAEKRYKCQIPIIEKRQKADFVIDNSGDLNQLEVQVYKLYEELTHKT